MSRLNEVAADVDTAFKEYRFDLAAQAIYGFTWNEYCDWYLELSKVVLNDPKASAAAQRGTRRTLVQVLETLLRLLHPITPFITEEIWQRVAALAGKTGATIMREPYPQAEPAAIDPPGGRGNALGHERDRRHTQYSRRDGHFAPAKLLPVLLQNGSAQDQALPRPPPTLHRHPGAHRIDSPASVPGDTWHPSRRPRWSATCRCSCRSVRQSTKRPSLID